MMSMAALGFPSTLMRADGGLEPPHDRDDDDQRNHLDDAERADGAEAAAAFPQGEAHRAQHMGGGAGEEDRGRELANAEDEDIETRCDPHRREEAQQAR